MSITTLTAKLVLNTDEWSTNIAKTSADLKKIQQSVANASDFVSNFGGKLLSGATKFAGWAGAGMAAKEGLERFMRAGQSTSDWLDRETAKWTGQIDGFFAALNHGDVSGFLGVMDKVRKAIDEAHRAMDDFADADASLKALRSSFDIQQRRLLQEIKRNKDNKSLVEANKQSLKELEANYRRQLGAVSMLKEEAVEKDIMAKISAPVGGGLDALGGYWTTNWLKNRTPKTSMESIKAIMGLESLGLYKDAAQMAKSVAKWIDLKVDGKKPGEWSDTMANEIIGKVDAYQKKYGVNLLDILKWDELDDDKGRKPIREGIQSYFDILKAEFEFAERNTEIFNMPLGGAKTTGASKKIYAEGTYGWYSQQISALQAKQKETSDIYELQRLQAQINSLKARQETIEVAVKTGQGLSGALPSIKGGVTKIKASDAIMPQGIGFPMVKVTDLSAFEQGLGGIAEMMRTISAVTNEGTQAWLNYASNAINAMRSLMTALQSVGMANAASQSAAAGPFGWLQVPLAIASMAVAFASIPKFASGGIVPGYSYSGDKVLAGLNSGEMVLNQSQQSKLFAMLNGASGSGAGSVEFEIRGDKLVGVLDNYNRRRRKIV